MSESVVPLITFDEGAYRLHDSAAEWLSQQTEPFAVMACAGKFRTGKSFLLNRFLRAPPGTGFGVGETVQACTRGIWMHKEWLKGEADESLPMLVLDTEGIDALDAESEHDVRIFVLAVLLASVFVYNQSSHLDEQAIQTLSLMTKVAQSVGDSGTHSPSLYWVLRDFALQLVDAAGNPLTHNQYLEQALDAGSTKCATRDAIKQVFTARHLVTLPRPHRGDRTHQLEHQTLAAKFDKCLNTFRAHVLTHATPVRASGVALTGPVYVEFVRRLLATINQGDAIPKLQDTWTLLSRMQHGEQENQARRALLAAAEETCPTGTDAAVRDWIRERCAAHCAALSFMDPPPDRDAMVERLAGEVQERCVSLGRVVSPRAVATDHLTTFLAVTDAAAVAADPQCLLRIYSLPFESATIRNIAFEELPRMLVEGGVLPAALHAAQRSGGEAASRNHALDLEATQLRLQHVQSNLDDALAREAKLDASAPPLPACEHATTQTDAHEVDGETEDGGALHTGDDAGARTDTDTERHAAALEARLDGATETIRVLQHRASHAEDHLARMQQVYDANVETIKKESSAVLCKAHRDRDAAAEAARRALEQKEGLADEAEQVRGSLREAQAQALEMHRSTLEEARRRDVEGRERADRERVEWGELRARADLAAQETRCLKRRVDELLLDAEEAKRLRAVHKQLELDHAREDALREALRSQIQGLRDDNDELRRRTIDLESRLAVAEATCKLESCRRELA